MLPRRRNIMYGFRLLLFCQSRLSGRCRFHPNRRYISSGKSSASSSSSQAINNAPRPAKKSPPAKTFSDTLNLPKSSFPLKHSRQLELEIEKTCAFTDLYKDEPCESKGDYILHDGPPYANGDVHFGHTINKTLKDIFLKRKRLEGYHIHYRPGWDCHGLPIELKAITEDQAHTLDPVEIRRRARALATGAIDRQRDAFLSWFPEGDFARPYLTYDLDYCLRELDAFYRLYSRRLIFRDCMPVYWSPSTRTALAEAELEYNDQHVSRAAYVKYPLVNSDILQPFGSADIFALIWTTTPWTLLANEGIAYSESIDYSLISLDDQLFLVATELIPELAEKLGQIRRIRSGIQSQLSLSDLKYQDPLQPDSTPKPFIASRHVRLSKGGTGLVHLAPNHGFDDYKLFTGSPRLKSSYRKESIVDHLGRLRLPPGVSPESIAIASQDNGASHLVLEHLMPQSVVRAHDHVHSYPYDWRSGKPVLILPSAQWFLDIDPIRPRILEALDQVAIYPERDRKEFVNQITQRPNWCLSRQRNWGVPIPVFYDLTSDPQKIKPVLNDDIYGKVLDHFRRDGLDAWWQKSPADLLGPEASNLSKGVDILDIWFDSGCSWLSVLGPDGPQADLYLEGIDQIRGWFQSSLIISVALRDRAPYKAVYVHGFALDKDRRKMSKSVGNVVDPADIIEDRLGKYLPDEPVVAPSRKSKKVSKLASSCGLDGLRLWVAQNAAYSNDVSIDVRDFREKPLLDVNRLRLTIRFLLGNVGHMSPDDSLLEPNDRMPLLDRYLLIRLAAFHRDMTEGYARMELPDVAKTLTWFFNQEVGSFYLSRLKDRLYCDSVDDDGSRSARTLLWRLYHTVGYHMAPILPHIALELNRELPLKRSEIFSISNVDELVRRLFPGIQSEPELMRRLRPLFSMIDTLNKRLADIGTPIPGGFDLRIATQDADVIECLKPNAAQSRQSDLVELLRVASVEYQTTPFDDELGGDDSERFRAVPKAADGEEEDGREVDEQLEEPEMARFEFELEFCSTKFGVCVRCRRHSRDPSIQDQQPDDQALCDRCSTVVGKLKTQGN